MRIATATALAAAAAVMANVLLRALAVAAFDIPQPEFEELNLRPVIVSTAGGVVAAGIVYALIRNRRRFLIVAVVALLLSLIAPLTIDDPNADAAAVGTLIAMHVVAAAISVPILLKRA
jgi:4-amino-4-deoxy-L-arabinose transferase-like glycosyltransferase